MAKFSIDIGDTFEESAIFWLTRYLLHKTLVFDNSKADKEKLKKAVGMLRPTPKSFEELLKAAKAVQKAGIGVYTLFYPVWLFFNENSQNPDFISLRSIDEEAVMQWLSSATASKSDATKRNYKVALTDFFGFLSKNNEERYHFDIDLKQWRRNLKNSLNKPPAFLNEKEVDLFLDGLSSLVVKKKGKSEKADEYSTALYRAVLKLTLVSGLRVSEIANLRLNDLEVDEENDVLILSVRNSKANKSRKVVVPYSRGKMAVKKELDGYLDLRRCAKACKERLFCAKGGGCLKRTTLDKVLRRYLLQIGIKKEKMGMHLLRHTHATYFYSKTKDPVLLQERLGHSDSQTTRRYIHLDDEKVKKSAEALR